VYQLDPEIRNDINSFVWEVEAEVVREPCDVFPFHVKFLLFSGEVEGPMEAEGLVDCSFVFEAASELLSTFLDDSGFAFDVVSKRPSSVFSEGPAKPVDACFSVRNEVWAVTVDFKYLWASIEQRAFKSEGRFKELVDLGSDQ
jgi:hypothetical protein